MASAVVLLPTILTSFLLLLLAASSASAQASERQTLLRLKSYWSDPPSLSSWSNASAAPHCSWLGVSCNASGRVSNLTLRSLDIAGGLPAFLCELAGLAVLDLYDNSIRCPLPSFLPNCSNLVHLNLGWNYLNGTLPADLPHALPAGLRVLDLDGNLIEGPIPPSIGQLSGLRSLSLDNNCFTTIPPAIGNLTGLERLTLANNSFPRAAPIPPEFAALKSLRYLWISDANLTGEVPEWLGSFGQLEHLDLSMNALSGTMPASVWGLPNLREIYLYHNRLSGPIPATIGAVGLVQIDVSMNSLNGSLPEELSKLRNLEILYLYYNNLSGAIPAGIGRLPSLRDVRLFGNRLTGALPPDLGNYSMLYNLEVTENRLSGELPATLCSKGNLQYIAVYSNEFTGGIPESLARCPKLRNVMFQQNRLSGEVPAAFWALPALVTVNLNGNALSGQLPTTLPRNMTRLEVGGNRFTGGVPRQAESLLVFRASSNALSGELPADFSGITKLQELLLDGNMISGAIPPSIAQLRQLSTLNLSRNALSGPIPGEIGSLPVLNYLDLSGNRLSGEIPTSFNNLKLTSLDLSHNLLTGPIPESLRIGAFDRSFLGNPGLCSGSAEALAGLPVCGGSNTGSSVGLPKGLLALALILGAAVVLAVAAFGFFAVRDLRRRRRLEPKWKMTKFQPLDFTESSILGALVPENRVGCGGAGEVYRVCAGGGAVAVKKIWRSKKMGARLEREFLAEVEILGSIRHMNIVKLLCCISGEEGRMLVYEYAENGSLYGWLHGKRHLDWPARVKIAAGAARALCYMHHDCSPPVAHWDVKSSNILLDADFCAKVTDFGLARMLADGLGGDNTVSTVTGSLGYMAPECAYSSKVNEKVDVYGFGVVLLELTTGRQAHDGDRNSSLAEWAWAHFQRGESAADLIDERIRNPLWTEEITTVMRLGLLCTGTLPSSRPSMRDVLGVLLRCGGAYDVEMEHGESDLGPYLYKVGGRSRKVRDSKDEGKEDRQIFITCDV